MSLLCGWVTTDPRAPAGPTVARMGRILRVHAGQAWATWELPGFALGLLAHPPREGSLQQLARPAVAGDGRFHLWLAGEVFAAPASLALEGAEESSTHAFRQRLLTRLLDASPRAVLPSLDGEYQIALWDGLERRLTLLTDRFGSLPLYWGESSEGFAFAGGVRGVLAAPGISPQPDREALREAVTYGGFRLGDRTNVEAVKMLPGSAWAVAEGGRLRRIDRTWSWSRIPAVPEAPGPELLAEIRRLWRQAVARRMRDTCRPGQTLSGGLDSRAILAEAAPRSASWTAITYGIAGCDDAHYAHRAAKAVGAAWVFAPLYEPTSPGNGSEASSSDWLEERSRHIQDTDGLIELVDLMHLESLPLQAHLLDLSLSGYIGDAVAGPTFASVSTAEEVLLNLPYYGGLLGLPWEEALDRVRQGMAVLEGAPPRFALFENKLPQSTNCWLAAQRPHFTVRRPFTDYELFDFLQGLPPAVRSEGKIYEHFLRTTYPECFAHIPNQKTGVPILSPPWHLQLARAQRFAWRQLQPSLQRLGLQALPRRRLFTADDEIWRRAGARERIHGTILRPGSLVCDIFGADRVREVLRVWEERAAAPVQVIGALYVYESYHRDLAGLLRDRSAAQGTETP